MHIDFAPPSNGTYNNAGSSRQLANYLEHEDLKRMEIGIYTEGFFNLTEDNIYKSSVIKDIDSNVGQLLKTDAKFYAIHVSPSENELRVMGNTEQEKAGVMKRYIREVFIPEYAKNFNKKLSASDIKFYGKIHFDRSRSNNELNMHCHLIVSRKDQSNKKKLSPLTNHKDTKNGVIKGGFDRVNLFQQVEQGFDKLFDYTRPFNESFEYYSIIKNNTIFKQLNMQKQQITVEKSINVDKQEELSEDMFKYKQDNSISNTQPVYQEKEKEDKQSVNLQDLNLYSGVCLFTPDLINKKRRTNSHEKKKEESQTKFHKIDFDFKS